MQNVSTNDSDLPFSALLQIRKQMLFAWRAEQQNWINLQNIKQHFTADIESFSQEAKSYLILQLICASDR